MQHRTFESLAASARIRPASEFAMSRRQRLERWARILQREPGRLVIMLNEIEHITGTSWSAARADRSAIALAFADPLFRREGLAGDTLGDAETFFGLSRRQAHHLLCACHLGPVASAGQISERISALARRPTLAERWTDLRSKIARLLAR